MFFLLAITDGSVRINNTSPSTGRVEVFYDGKWGTICDDAWDLNDAHVICRQLGFKQALQAYKSAYHGQGSGPIWLDDLACSGSEKNLHDCRHRGWGKHDCTHGRDASVKCTYGSSIIRLAGGSHNYGRVEVLVGGRWGTICDRKWDINDAKVVCRQLGFKGAASAPRGAAYGRGSGPIQRSLVYCEGNEESLLDCPYCPSYYCRHSEDASVVCHNWTLTDIKTPSNTEVIDVLLPVIVVQVGLIVVLVVIAVVVKLYVIRRFRSGRKKFIVNNKHYWKNSSSPR